MCGVVGHPNTKLNQGQMSAVVGQELWESLCWQRGSFQHVYIASRFNKLEQDAAGDACSLNFAWFSLFLLLVNSSRSRYRP